MRLNEEKHENALHIYLPDSMTTWIYLNLDCRMHDFKFWMAHEMGHIHAPQLQGETGEDFAESFAAALLMPEELAAQEYGALCGSAGIGAQINRIKTVAESLVVSPLTVYCEINKYAAQNGKPKIDLESGNEIHKTTSILFYTDGLTNHLKEIQCTHESEAGKTGNADVGLSADAQASDGQNRRTDRPAATEPRAGEGAIPSNGARRGDRTGPSRVLSCAGAASSRWFLDSG